VSESNDPLVWEALEKAIKGASVGLRMQLLQNVTYHHEDEMSEIQRKRPLAILAAFLDDTTLRDRSSDSKKYDGPCAGFTYKRLSVQDHVAMEMARLLNIEIELNPKRTQEEWAKVRKRGRDAWLREQKREGKIRESNVKEK
jgi:hypothetical protein